MNRRDTNDTTRDKAKDVANEAKMQANEAADQAKQKASELTDQAKQKANELTNQAKQKVDEVTDQAREKAAETAGKAVGSVIANTRPEEVREFASEITKQVSATQAGKMAGAAAQGAAEQVNPEDVKRMADDAVNQAKQKADDVMHQAQQQATSVIRSQKETALHELNSLAEALRTTSKNLRQQDQAAIASYTDMAARQIEDISNYLQKDVSQLLNDAERFARRQPALFLGSAFALGILAARFVKSSGQQAQSSQYQSTRQYQAGSQYQYGSQRGTGQYQPSAPDMAATHDVTPPPQYGTFTSGIGTGSYNPTDQRESDTTTETGTTGGTYGTTRRTTPGTE